MVKKSFAMKVIVIMLIVSLMYAHSNVLMFGLISYAYNDDDTINTQETKKVLEIDTSELLKDEMETHATAYVEKLKLLNTETTTTIIDDIETSVLNEEEQDQGIEIIYKNSEFLKAEMLQAIGETGSITFTYDDPEDGTESVIVINADTEADEYGAITVSYPTGVTSVKIEVNSENTQTEAFEIFNNKEIAQLSNADEVGKLRIKKTVQTSDEAEPQEEENIVDLYYKYSSATLGIDKTELSTSIENQVQFTITMNTSQMRYDLFKNPYFVIELPDEVMYVQTNEITLVNANEFSIQTTKVGKLENGNLAIMLELNGEQTSYANSLEEEGQIVINAKVTTLGMIPTKDTTATLYYKNENASSYDGVVKGGEEGTEVIDIRLVSKQNVMTQIQAVTEDNIVYVRENESNKITVKESNQNKLVTLAQTIINNVGEELQNIKILGKGSYIGQIRGMQKVYYTAKEDAGIDVTDATNGWTQNYISNAKQYLIIVENFADAEILSYQYTMALPQKVEEETEYDVKLEVYNGNNQLIQSSQITVAQEAENTSSEENEKIQANMVIDNTNKIEVGDVKEVTIEVKNISNETIDDLSIDLELPETLALINAAATVDGEKVSMFLNSKNFSFEGGSVKLEPQQVLKITLKISLLKVNSQKENIKAVIKYGEENVEISNYMNVAAQSAIQTNITSNKIGKELSANEEIIYEVTLVNTGESNASVDLEILGLDNMDIKNKKIVNLSTNETSEVGANSLSNKTGDVKIGAGQTVKFYVRAVAKELKKQTVQFMYVTVKGDKIINTETAKLSNTINKKTEEKPPVEDPDPKPEEKGKSSIIGVAWLDKNENGRNDDADPKLKGIQVFLIDATTSKVVSTTVTNNKGEYSFNDISEGKYVVKFKYNTNLFTITEYKKENIEDNLDSDVINTTQNGETETKTEVIELVKDKKEQVNIGLILKQKFDLSINNKIRKITVNNDNQKETYNFNDNIAKVEIKEKNFKNSMLLVEYEIEVSSVEEIEGYANRISVEIPEGMSFNSELNTNWYEKGDGKVYTEELANKKLAKGETATVKLVLTMNLKEAKVLNIENVANIEETSNEYLVKDTYTKNNASRATVIVSIATGQAQSYMWLAFTVIAIITIGTYGVLKINKKALRNN